MLQLENSELRVELLDPADPIDAARQGWRYCWGGYIWQVHDKRLGPLVSGPEYPKPDPSAFNGQGLPESFRHRTREGNPFTWHGPEGVAIGAGRLRSDDKNEIALVEPAPWIVTCFPDHLMFQTRQAVANVAYELTRQIELRDRTVSSHSQLTNLGGTTLTLQWFAHPFWALTGGRAQVKLPAGTTVPENPGFTVAADGMLTFRRPFVAVGDSQFALLTLPARRELALALDHPKLARVTFATRFIPDECPVWANAHTVSVEPYLNLALAPGETRQWHVQHGFAA